jgi:hypothetical protein
VITPVVVILVKLRNSAQVIVLTATLAPRIQAALMLLTTAIPTLSVTMPGTIGAVLTANMTVIRVVVLIATPLPAVVVTPTECALQNRIVPVLDITGAVPTAVMIVHLVLVATPALVIMMALAKLTNLLAAAPVTVGQQVVAVFAMTVPAA